MYLRLMMFFIFKSIYTCLQIYMFTKHKQFFFFFFFFLVKQLSSGLHLLVIRKTFKFAVFYLYMNEHEYQIYSG